MTRVANGAAKRGCGSGGVATESEGTAGNCTQLGWGALHADSNENMQKKLYIFSFLKIFKIMLEILYIKYIQDEVSLCSAVYIWVSLVTGIYIYLSITHDFR